MCNPMVVDLTADSSCEGSSGSNHLQVVGESTPVETRPKLQDDLPPVTFANTTITSQQPNMDSATLSPPATQLTSSGLADPRTEFPSSVGVSGGLRSTLTKRALRAEFFVLFVVIYQFTSTEQLSFDSLFLGKCHL